MYKNIICYYLKSNYIIPILIGISGLFVYFCITSQGTCIPDLYANFWDPFISIFSFALTIGLTFIYIRKEWLEQLPQKLNIHFVNIDGNYLASCYNVNVVGNADIRALGQQVGAQMFQNKFINFNPSLHVIHQGIPIEVKNKENKNYWIKYTEIVFQLRTNEYNDTSTYYSVWHINNNETARSKFKVSKNAFHVVKGRMSINDLLSDNDEAYLKFVKIKEDNTEIKRKYYLTNSPIVTGNGVYEYTIIDIGDAKEFIKDKELISAIGHESTAHVLTNLLGIPVKQDRIQIKLDEGDQCLVFRLKDRVKENKQYTIEELSNMPSEFGILSMKSI